MVLSVMQRTSKNLAKDTIRAFVRCHDMAMLQGNDKGDALVVSHRSRDAFQGSRNEVIGELMPIVKRFLRGALPLDISLLAAGALADEMPTTYPSNVTGNQMIKYIAVYRLAHMTFVYLERKYEEDERLKSRMVDPQQGANNG